MSPLNITFGHCCHVWSFVGLVLIRQPVSLQLGWFSLSLPHLALILCCLPCIKKGLNITERQWEKKIGLLETAVYIQTVTVWHVLHLHMGTQRKNMFCNWFRGLLTYEKWMSRQICPHSFGIQKKQRGCVDLRHIIS